MFKKLIILVVCLFCTVTPLPVSYEDPEDFLNHVNKLEEDDEHRAEFRLPHNTEPRLYILEFDPDFVGEKFTFKGNGTILFEVLQPSASVTLHRSIKIVIDEDSIEITDEKGNFHQPLAQKWNPDNDFFTIKFDKNLEPGNYTLKVKWVSNDNDNEYFSTDSGFFRVQEDYKDENSDYLIATLFQPISARTAFPCWDEPGFKAQFELSIKHYPNYTALSNMPEKSHQQLSDGKILTQFERSVKMSSYNPCIIVANCKAVKSNDRNITFYGLKDDVERLELPLKISESVVKILEDYTGIPYALSKLDQFAIPEADMPAMENWGLITYPSMFIKFQNKTLIPDVERYDSIASLVAHEVSHQWFGNLITSVWWNDLWLSEAFASYFSFKVLDQIEKDRPTMDYFTVRNNNEAMDLEFPPHTGKPIKWEPSDKDTIIGMFGAGTYLKGAGVIQMLENILSEDVFRDGIRRYLKTHQFSAVTSDNLWEALQEAHNEAYGEKSLNIKEIMEPWILQRGVPVLTVTRNYETGETNITQDSSLNKNLEIKWDIPINYATESNPDFSSTLPTLWMNKDQKTITLPSINKDDWIIVNIKQKGYYTVKYDIENWKRLIKYLMKDHEKIHPVNRAQLIITGSKLVIEDYSNSDILFKLLLYLHREKDYVPWIVLSQILSKISDEFQNTNYEDLFNDYIRFVTNAIGKSNIFDKENLESVRIRKAIAPLLCNVGNSNCLSYAHRLFDQFINDPSENAFPGTDWYWVICTGLKEANDSVWERFPSFKYSLIDSTVRSHYNVIRCTNDTKKRDNYLMKSMESESVFFVGKIIKSLLDSNRQDVNYIMDYFCDHFEDIERFFNKSDSSQLEEIMKKMFSSVQNQDQLEKMKKLVAAHKDKLNVIFSETPYTVDQLIESIEPAIEASTNFLPKFKELFDKYVTREADGSLKLNNIFFNE